jgi:hypothetical protein
MLTGEPLQGLGQFRLIGLILAVSLVTIITNSCPLIRLTPEEAVEPATTWYGFQVHAARHRKYDTCDRTCKDMTKTNSEEKWAGASISKLYINF